MNPFGKCGMFQCLMSCQFSGGVYHFFFWGGGPKNVAYNPTLQQIWAMENTKKQPLGKLPRKPAGSGRALSNTQERPIGCT